MQWDTCPTSLCHDRATESGAVGKEGFGNGRALPGQGSSPGMVHTPACSSSPAFSELVAVLAAHPHIRDGLHDSARDE